MGEEKAEEKEDVEAQKVPVEFSEPGSAVHTVTISFSSLEEG